ncbi:MAG: dihydroorotate dehydrogenase B catalytic subunit [Planctomycetes bacterium RBG_16_43_13]|nr:MAG: dihydroorotate dehydrogenase B catalytic subunit [Planctomycetes bacterium RBG_16_43_13]
MTKKRSQKAVDLSVNIGILKLANPVMVASGTFGGAFDNILDVDKLGAVIIKTVTLHPRKGNPPPRIVETPSGLVNSIGLENKGLDAFVKDELPRLSKYKTKLIISISGKNADEYIAIVEKLNNYDRIDALELNISCPNVSGGMDYGTNPELTESVVNAVKNISRFFVIAKLTPNVTDITKIASAAINGGADAISLINTIKALPVDWRKSSPRLGGITGGLSGPAIKTVALRFVWEVASRFNIPIIGIGGIADANDVLEFMCVGASAVQVGTANFVDCTVTEKILNELPLLLAKEGITDINSVIRSFKVKFDGSQCH